MVLTGLVPRPKSPSSRSSWGSDPESSGVGGGSLLSKFKGEVCSSISQNCSSS